MRFRAPAQQLKDIVAVTQLDAAASFKTIRRLSAYRDHTIRYYLTQALDRGLIRRRCFVNLNLLGLSYYEVCVALSAGKKELRNGLVEKLKASDRVSWLGRLGGDFHYGLTMVARNIAEVSEYLCALSAEFSGVFFEKAVALRMALHYSAISI